MKNKILVIVGPTAVGKTNISVELAKKFDTEIISADSVQVYRHMDIGSAKVTAEEAKGIKHHMIDIVNPDEEFSVSDFKNMAEMYIDKLILEDKLPIVIGGSGLYVNSLLYDLDFGQVKSDESIKMIYRQYLENNGIDKLHELLIEKDPIAAQNIHKNNTKRVIRALEVCHLTGEKFSDMSTDIRKPGNKYECIVIGLTMDRELLYDRINKRVDLMFEDGLLEEVQNILDLGYDKNLISLRAIGYKEIFPFLEGVVSKEETLEILKQNTRRFAKRQYTWFNADENIRWFDLSNLDKKQETIEDIYRYVKELI